MTDAADGAGDAFPGTARSYGDRALLLEFDDATEVLTWSEALRGARVKGVVDVVPAATTVLVAVAGPSDLATLRARLGELRVPAVADTAPTDRPADVTINVIYDGDDLDEVARLSNLSPNQVVEAHTAAPVRVGFGGFAPGFAYLVGGDARLHVPRRSDPRTKVPAGSVGLAGEFCGIYPRETPGGWQLIGRTDAVLWDVDGQPPALLTPGMWVRFRSVGGRP